MKRKTALGVALLPLLSRAAQAQGRAPIKVGITIPQTGAQAATAAEFLPAFQLGIDAVNEAGGVKGRPLQLLVEDSQASPQAGIAAMRKLAQVDGVKAMLTIFTNVVTAQIPLADQLQMPTVGIVEAPGIVYKSSYVFAHGVRTSKVDPLLSAFSGS